MQHSVLQAVVPVKRWLEVRGIVICDGVARVGASVTAGRLASRVDPIDALRAE